MLGVAPHEVGGQLVHLGLGVEPHLLRRLAQGALVLALVQVVEAEVVERVAEAVLVKEGSGHHRVGDVPLDLDTLAAHPTNVVHGVVEDVGAVRVRADVGQPAQGHARIEVAPVCMADGEVPRGPLDGDSDANDVPLAGGPPSPRLLQPGVVGLKIYRDKLGVG